MRSPPARLPARPPDLRLVNGALGPCVVLADLLELLGREVVRNVEFLPNLLRRLALDQVGDGPAPLVQQRLPVDKVGSLENGRDVVAVSTKGMGENNINKRERGKKNKYARV